MTTRRGFIRTSGLDQMSDKVQLSKRLFIES
jgi:hypothetical protein